MARLCNLTLSEVSTCITCAYNATPFSVNLRRIVRKAGGAVAPVHIQNMPRDPAAFIRGKVEGSVRDGINGAVTLHWNALEVAPLARRSVPADASLDWSRC